MKKLIRLLFLLKTREFVKIIGYLKLKLAVLKIWVLQYFWTKKHKI